MKLILETERLYLREFTLQDAPLFMALNSNPNVIRYTGDGPIENLQMSEHILTTITFPQYEKKLGRWATFLKSGDEFIGWCGLKYIAELDETDLGYRFFEQHWGKGYATESAKAVLEYGFNTLGLSEIVARAAVENMNSHKVLKKTGMQFEKEGFEHGNKILKYRLGRDQFRAQ